MQAEREAPQSKPQGFMIRQEFTLIRLELDQQYFQAADLLIESIKRDEWEDDQLFGPALFLYRHLLELLLKSLVVCAPRTHDLAALAQDLDREMLGRTGHYMPPCIMLRLREIAPIDSGSTAFDYGENSDPDLRCDVPPVPSATYISRLDLLHLQRFMLTLNRALRAAIAEVARDHPVGYPEGADFESG